MRRDVSWAPVRLARAISGTGTVDGRLVELEVRCAGCGKRLAEYAAPPYGFRCPRCKLEVKSLPLK